MPFLTAHLQWVGLNLQEIGIINLTAGLGSSFGLLLAAAANRRRRPWNNPSCGAAGHRSKLALAVLLAAFCGIALILVPRISGRSNPYGRDASYGLHEDEDRPLAEILCRPEGSALFFQKCGDTCELDSVTRTELVVSDCRFESQNRFPGQFSINWIKIEIKLKLRRR